MLAATGVDILTAVVSVQVTAIVALAIVLGRTRERVVKLEEWARLAEKRWNGKDKSVRSSPDHSQHE